MFYNYNTNEYINKKEESLGLSFLYNTIIGRIILKIAISKFISNLYAKYMNSKLSIHKINKFIKKNNIDMSEYEEKKYISFNDFFIRKIKKNKRKINDGLISVCDSKLSVYEIHNGISFNIKNSNYTIDELIKEDSSKYNFKYALVFRLCVDDYHHYIYPDNGKVVSSKHIPGKLHTVRPIAFKKNKVFTENSRCISFLDCENLGKMCYIEVGALMIGKIVNESKTQFKKGDEKGHFEFGGSTVIMLLEDNVKIDKKLINLTKEDIEIIVKLGNKIGTIKN